MEYPSQTMIVTVYYKDGQRKEFDAEIAALRASGQVASAPEGFRHLENNAFNRIVVMGSPKTLMGLASVDMVAWRPITEG